MKKALFIFFMTFLVSSNFNAYAMSNPFNWCKKKFGSTKKELTSEEKAAQINKEWISLIGKSWTAKEVARIKELIAAGANVDYGTMLIACTYNQNLEIARLLLYAGADLNFKTVRNKREEKRDNIFFTIFGKSNLVRAMEDSVIVVQNVRPTALLSAALQGQLDFVQLLLAEGADCTEQNYYGHTALDLAREKGHKDIVKLLSEKKKLA